MADIDEMIFKEETASHLQGVKEAASNWYYFPA
jgi:hypothetical protein